MSSGRWQVPQKMLSVAGSIAVISSVVLGADAGVLGYGATGSPVTAAECQGGNAAHQPEGTSCLTRRKPLAPRTA
jgi:hypothetical protein